MFLEMSSARIPNTGILRIHTIQTKERAYYMKRRLLALMLAICLIVGMSIPAYAAENAMEPKLPEVSHAASFTDIILAPINDIVEMLDVIEHTALQFALPLGNTMAACVLPSPFPHLLN